MFEPKKYTELFDALRSRIQPVLTDFETGSVTRTLAESFAYEMGLLYEKMHKVYLSAFVDTAEGSQLDQVVSILGIKRGLPDYSSGSVVFLRDVGNEDIVVPVGTLVATEDLPELPKKMYQTIEPVTLTKNQAEAEAKVQAMQRGEDLDANAETITVMPRPIPGIKSVINRNPVKLTGKRRETDDELRERAKNALISSGKATILSIENAVLSLSGVRDVRVRERFRFAEGEITVMGVATEAFQLQGGSLLGSGVAPNRKMYKTKDDLQFAVGSNSLKVKIQAMLEGNEGVGAASDVLTFETGLNGGFGINVTKPIELGEFGVIEVYVDAAEDEFQKAEFKQSILAEIDKVRAAGIMAFLEAATQLETRSVFRIEAIQQANLPPEAITALELKVAGELEIFFKELRMGQPLLFSKLTKKVLSIEGVDNLADLHIVTSRKMPGDLVRENTYRFSDNKIIIDDFEIFNPKEICVASEDKSLPIHIEFKATAVDKTAIANALNTFFNGKKQGDLVKKSEITQALQAVPGLDLLKIKASSWCEREVLRELPGNDDLVGTTFVEKPVLGELFIYQDLLELEGTVRLVLPLNMMEVEQNEVLEKAKVALENFIDSLKAEQDLVFDELAAVLSKVEKVLDVEIDKTSFILTKDGTILSDRKADNKIDVREFEKIKLKNFKLIP